MPRILTSSDLEALAKAAGKVNTTTDVKGLKPSSATTNQIVKQYRRKLPPGVLGLIRKETPQGRRSDHIFAVAMSLAEAGMPIEHAMRVLVDMPTTQSKGDVTYQAHRALSKAYVKSNHRNGNGRRKSARKTKSTPVPQDELLTITASDIELEQTTWLWPGLIPMGNITILGGRPGGGKSQWTSRLAAKVTKGTIKGSSCRKGNVLIASLEDSVSQTIGPRLKAVHANMGKVHLISGVKRDGESDVLSLPRDTDLILAATRKWNVKLLVLDPLSAILGAGATYDSNREADVRRALAPVAQAAEEGGFAVVAVMHLRKQLEEEALMNLSGSGAFGAAARSVLILGYNPREEDEDTDERVLAQVKCNLGPIQVPQRWKVRATEVEGPRGPIKTSMLSYLGASEIDAHEVTSSKGRPQGGSKLERAVAYLEEALSSKPRKAAELIAEAGDMDIGEDTLKRAKKRLGVDVRPPRGPGTSSMWSLNDAS